MGVSGSAKTSVGVGRIIAVASIPSLTESSSTTVSAAEVGVGHPSSTTSSSSKSRSLKSSAAAHSANGPRAGRYLCWLISGKL